MGAGRRRRRPDVRGDWKRVLRTVADPRGNFPAGFAGPLLWIQSRFRPCCEWDDLGRRLARVTVFLYLMVFYCCHGALWFGFPFLSVLIRYLTVQFVF